MERTFETTPRIPFSPLPAKERVCRVECQGCGASAEVGLEFFVPTDLPLRCLGCGSDHVLVTPVARPL